MIFIICSCCQPAFVDDGNDPDEMKLGDDDDDNDDDDVNFT